MSIKISPAQVSHALMRLMAIIGGARQLFDSEQIIQDELEHLLELDEWTRQDLLKIAMCATMLYIVDVRDHGEDVEDAQNNPQQKF